MTAIVFIAAQFRYSCSSVIWASLPDGRNQPPYRFNSLPHTRTVHGPIFVVRLEKVGRLFIQRVTLFLSLCFGFGIFMVPPPPTRVPLAEAKGQIVAAAMLRKQQSAKAWQERCEKNRMDRQTRWEKSKGETITARSTLMQKIKMTVFIVQIFTLGASGFCRQAFTIPRHFFFVISHATPLRSGNSRPQ